MLSTLSQIGIAKLQAEPSPDEGAELASKLAHEIDSPKLNENKLKLAQDIVRIMANDIETAVRQALWQSLRRATRLRHDRERYPARMIERVHTQYENFGPEHLDDFLDKLGDILNTA